MFSRNHRIFIRFLDSFRRSSSFSNEVLFRNKTCMCNCSSFNRRDKTELINKQLFSSHSGSSYRSGAGNKLICENDKFDECEEDLVYDKEYEKLIKRAFRTPDMGHEVFVIQPFVKWGPSKKHLTKPDYQLNEAVALVETLDGWNVVGKLKISLTSLKRIKLFGKGNLELLKEKIRKDKMISAVFVSINLLSRLQQEFLEEEFGVPVYDRYNIVIQIFRKHAVTTEAKLQVAMAELPFMWYRIKSNEDKGGGGPSGNRGSGESLLELRKRLLTEKEQKIKKALKKLSVHRALLRKKRQKQQYPVVAVVGYTNAGKTSLIKVLTQETTLTPRNQLFATLDVTVHEGILPRNVKVLYVDTIGFISDIPTELIEPFTVTLEDAVQSDVLIHIMDISNPDILAQSKHVVDTLEKLRLDNKLLTNIINVANKCDLVSEKDCLNIFTQFQNFETYNDWIKRNDVIEVSCVKNIGLELLRNKVENVLLKLTGRLQIKIRIKCGGPEFNWLYKESSIIEVISDEKDPQFVYLDVIITENNLMRFKHIFINSKQYRKSAD